MAGLFGSKKDTRPIDVGLASLVGSDETTAIEFWKKRLEMTAAVPSEIARVGALTPQMRELSRIGNVEERKRLTRARLIAFTNLPPEQRQLLVAARRKAFDRAWKHSVHPDALQPLEQALRIAFDDVITNMEELSTVGVATDEPTPTKG